MGLNEEGRSRMDGNGSARRLVNSGKGEESKRQKVKYLWTETIIFGKRSLAGLILPWVPEPNKNFLFIFLNFY